MPVTEHGRSPEEIAVLGTAAFDRYVRPNLQSQDYGKFVAIDVLSGDYELDEDDHTSIIRLRNRRPAADIWLGRIGQPAAYRIGRNR